MEVLFVLHSSVSCRGILKCLSFGSFAGLDGSLVRPSYSGTLTKTLVLRPDLSRERKLSGVYRLFDALLEIYSLSMITKKQVFPAISSPMVNPFKDQKVSKLGFGCGGLSGYYNAPLSHDEGCSVIKEAFHRGITFFDTSDAYGRNNDNEILVGKVLKQLPREKVQLATKFGISVLPESTKAMGLVDQIRITGTPEYVRKCCEASLKRLDVDYIDLYYQHRVDISVPIEETMEELKKLVEEGKVKYIGLSEASPDTIRRAHAVHPITALQMEYSLLYRGIEKEVIPLCRELGIGIVAYSPLGRGFFGGKAAVESINSESILGSIPMFAGENLERNKVHYARIAEFAIKHGCTPSQLALAWLFHQGDDVVPIPGTTKLMNLDNNIRSLVVKLNKEDSKSISEAVPVDSVVGERQLPYMYKYSWDFATTPPKNKNSSAT